MRLLVGPTLALALFACGGGDKDDGSGSAGVAGAGGGKGGTGGTGGNGGAAGGAGAGPSFGTVGSGDVRCDASGSMQCGPRTVCCAQSPLGATSCVASFAQCPCSANWSSCAVYGCDGPEDCSGAVCCATPSPADGFHEFAGSSCKPNCGAADEIVCKTATDCPNGSNCDPSGEFFNRCF